MNKEKLKTLTIGHHNFALLDMSKPYRYFWCINLTLAQELIKVLMAKQEELPLWIGTDAPDPVMKLVHEQLNYRSPS